MDFGSLLQTAKQNDSKSSSANYYKSKFEAPKKHSASKEQKLSQGVQAFLAKKKEEEERKKIQDEKKMQGLFEARSHDSKSKKRVSLMLKSTKAANKAAIADARDDVNTAITAMGPIQPDEDDYGYTSKEASAYYDTLLDKLMNTPDDPKFSKKLKTTAKNADQINEAKDRVRQAIEKQREEEMMPHRRKRRTKDKGDDCDDDEPVSKKDKWKWEEEEERAPAPPKPKKQPPPPPMNFQELLLLAAQKKDEPVAVQPKAPPKTDEPERPMTKREKAEFERQRQHKERREAREKEQKEEVPNKKVDRKPEPTSTSFSKPTFNRIPKKSSSEQQNSDTRKPSGYQSQTEARSATSRPESKTGSFKASKVESQRETYSPSCQDRNRKQPQKPNGYKSGPSEREMSSKSSLKSSERDSPRDPYKKTPLPNKTSSSTTNGYPPRPKPRDDAPRARENSSANSRQGDVKSTSDRNTLGNKNIPNQRPLDRRYEEQDRRTVDQDRKQSQIRKPEVERRLPEQDRKLTGDRRPLDQAQRQKLEQINRGVTNKRPLEAERRPIPQDKRPLPQDRRPVPQDGRPVPQDRRPVPQDRRPVPQDRRPVPQDRRPVPQDRRPVPQDRRPVPQDRRPVPQQGRLADRAPPSRPLPPGVRPGDRRPLPSAASGHPNRPTGSQPPPRPGQSRPPNPQQRRRPPSSNKRRIESDSEYDSEMDDFIDDAPLDDQEDISSVIKEIFGYDKSRYRNYHEEDDECMESNFAQQMKEEVRSAKLGMMEDLEDIRLEKEMEKRKKMRMMSSKKKSK